MINEKGRLRGENTDGKGFIKSIKDECGDVIAGAKVLVLGAGGAARAIAVELALAGASELFIVNRTRNKGEGLVQTLNQKTKCKAQFIPWDGVLSVPEKVQIIINATSIGLFPAVGDAPAIEYDSIRPGLIVCDVIPNPPRTRFLSYASQRGRAHYRRS